MLRLIVAYPLFVIITIVGGLCVLLISPCDKNKSGFHIVAKLWVWTVRKLAGIRIVRTNHAGRINMNESFVVVANHASLVDPVVLVSVLPLRAVWVAKYELRKIPIFWQALMAGGCIPVTRQGSKTEARERFSNIGAILRKRKCSVVFFAEGTRSPDGSIQPFKKGAFITALNENLRILPVAFTGTENIIPKGKPWMVRPGVVEATIGQPITPSGDPETLAETVRQNIIALKEQNKKIT